MMQPATVLRSCATSRQRLSRAFSTTASSRNVLFNLGGLAASREGQYLSKEHGIPRTEYSSNIHLIRSSEVDPFAPLAPGASKHAKASRGSTKGTANHHDGPSHLDDKTRAYSMAYPRKQGEELKTTAEMHHQAYVDYDLVARLQNATEEITRLKTAVDALQWRADRIPLAIILGTPLLVFVGVVGHLFWEEHQADLADAAAAAAQAQAETYQAQKMVSQVEADEVPVRAVRPETRMERRAQDPNRHFLDAFFWAPGSFGK